MENNAASETAARQLESLIEEVCHSEISTIHQTLSRIIRIINDPSSSAKQLKDVIELDPPLSAKVLRRANSAFYGASHSIDEIQQAIVWLGFDLVKELALSQKVCQLFEHNGIIGDFTRSGLWKHSVAVALCAKLISRREFRQRGDNVYAAGLLHDVGLIIEDQFRHAEFIRIHEGKHRFDDNLPPSELKVLGFDHAQIGRRLSESWNFPVELEQCIGYHHSPKQANEDLRRSVLILYVADQLCMQEGLGFCDEPKGDRELLQDGLKELDIKGVAAYLIVTEVVEEIDRMEKQGWFLP